MIDSSNISLMPWFFSLFSFGCFIFFFHFWHVQFWNWLHYAHTQLIIVFFFFYFLFVWRVHGFLGKTAIIFERWKKKNTQAGTLAGCWETDILSCIPYEQISCNYFSSEMMRWIKFICSLFGWLVNLRIRIQIHIQIWHWFIQHWNDKRPNIQ